MVAITNKKRFDDVGPQDPDGFREYAYHGYNYDIVANDHVFQVRIYDNERVATVISPSNARECPEARQLLDFIVGALDCPGIRFYSASDGAYRRVKIETLEFVES